MSIGRERSLTRISLSLTCVIAALAGTVLIGSSLGCGAQLSGEGFPTCGDDSGVECPPVPCTASKVLYHCEMNLAGHSLVSNVGVCLPPDLNMAIGDAGQQANIAAMCEAGTYDKAVFDYGQNILAQIAALGFIDGTGMNNPTQATPCSDLGNFFDAGLNDAGHLTNFCNPIDSGLDDAGQPIFNIDYCEDAAVFNPVNCCGSTEPDGGPFLNDAGFCTNNDCHSFISGITAPQLNINNCMCNTVPQNPAECFIDAGTVVFPPQGNDPPNATTNGVISHALSAMNTATLDPTSSYVKATIDFHDQINVDHSDTQQSQLAGEAAVYGKRQSDGTATVLFDGAFIGTNLHFHFGGVDVVGNVDLDVKNISMSIGAGTNEIFLDSSGLGTIPSGAMAIALRAMINGQLTVVRRTNDTALILKVDFNAKTFSMPAFTFSPTGTNTTVTVALSGTLTNQPPMVDSGGDQTVECTSPSGGEVALSGSASDPDNDLTALSWFAGPPVPKETFPQFPLINLNTWIGNTTILTTIAPFTPPSQQTGYTLVAQDHTLQIDFSQAVVTVRDTTPPTLTIAATPSCLWPPNHTMVLYQLDSTLADTVTDTCDLQPKVEIVSVTSDQPPLGGGSGSTATDVTFGTQAFCVRAERDGTNPSPRHYTVVVRATDASGNSSTQSLTILVPHDQSTSCSKTPTNQLVVDDDPRCAAN